jgi:TIR domain
LEQRTSGNNTLMESLTQYDIFISYRRDGGEHLAGRVKDALRTRGFSAFMDVEDLKSGKFCTALLKTIKEATDVIVILTPGCLDRCRNEGDWLRLEIRHAIECEKNIVPVIARGFRMPPANTLPHDIAALVEYNGFTPSHDVFEASMNKLVSTFLKSKVSNSPQVLIGKDTSIASPIAIPNAHRSNEAGTLIAALGRLAQDGLDEQCGFYNAALSHCEDETAFHYIPHGVLENEVAEYLSPPIEDSPNQNIISVLIHEYLGPDIDVILIVDVAKFKIIASLTDHDEIRRILFTCLRRIFAREKVHSGWELNIQDATYESFDGCFYFIESDSGNKKLMRYIDLKYSAGRIRGAIVAKVAPLGVRVRRAEICRR